MRRTSMTVGLALALSAVPSATAAQDEAGPAGDLFVQTARGGSLTSGDDGRLVLTLEGVDPRAVYFSERPQRTAGTLPTAAMVAAAFGAPTDPNAALLIEGEGSSDVIPLALSAPVIDDGAITYAAALLEALPEQFAAYDVIAAHTDIEFGEAALFIDSGGTTYQIIGGAQLVVPWTRYPVLVTNVGQGDLYVEGSDPPGMIRVQPGLVVQVSDGPDQLSVTNQGPLDGQFTLHAAD